MNKSKLFKTAWSLLKGGLFSNFADALKAAWAKFKLRMALKAGAVKLSFKKVDGTTTERLATLDARLFEYATKGRLSNEVSGLVKFWSLTDNAFRSMKIENLIGFSFLNISNLI